MPGLDRAFSAYRPVLQQLGRNAAASQQFLCTILESYDISTTLIRTHFLSLSPLRAQEDPFVFSTCSLHSRHAPAVNMPYLQFKVAGDIIKTDGFGTLYKGLSAGLLRQATYTTARLGIFNNISEELKRINEGKVSCCKYARQTFFTMTLFPSSRLHISARNL